MNYRILYEDPTRPDEPAKVVVPAPEWIEQALQGGILPEINSILDDQDFEEEWTRNNPGKSFSWFDHGGAKQWTAPAVGPMTLEEAMEYLAMKDVPNHVWRAHQRSNYPYVVITTTDKLPDTREWRNAWRLT